MATAPILIAGKNGQLARCLRDSAINLNTPVISVGRPELDFEDAKTLDRVLAAVKPSAIINAAAYTAVDRAETEPTRAFAINRDGAARLADAARRKGIPFIHVSTDYVFDGRKKSSYREDDNTAPLNVYGASKLAGEVAVLDACPHAVIVRTSWIYSPYGSNFVRTMLRLSETQSVVRVVDDQRGTPTCAVDLAQAILKMAERLRLADYRDLAGVYHLSGEGETSWHDFAAAVFANLARLGRKAPRLQAITTAEYPTPALRPKNSCLDSSKADRIFGVRLPPWRSSLDACLGQMEVPEELRAC